VAAPAVSGTAPAGKQSQGRVRPGDGAVEQAVSGATGGRCGGDGNIRM
jgi:hypothetical protein